MEDLMKGVTVAAIAVGIYLAVKYRNAGQVKTCSVPPWENPGTLTEQPMESSNCAIPLATDYLPGAQEYSAPVSQLTVRTPRPVPVLNETRFCRIPRNPTSPVNIGNPANPNVCYPVDLRGYCPSLKCCECPHGLAAACGLPF